MGTVVSWKTCSLNGYVLLCLVQRWRCMRWFRRSALCGRYILRRPYLSTGNSYGTFCCCYVNSYKIHGPSLKNCIIIPSSWSICAWNLQAIFILTIVLRVPLENCTSELNFRSWVRPRCIKETVRPLNPYVCLRHLGLTHKQKFTCYVQLSNGKRKTQHALSNGRVAMLIAAGSWHLIY